MNVPFRPLRHFRPLAWGSFCAAVAFAPAHATDSEPPPAPVVRVLPSAGSANLLSNVSLFRVDNEHAVLRVETRTPVPPSALRLLLDLDPAERGDRDSGADLMIEGGVGFIPGKGGGLRWSEKGRMPWLTGDGAEKSRTHWMLLPPISGPQPSFGWAVESVAGGKTGTAGSRRPAKGLARANLGELPILEPPAIEPPPPLKESMQKSDPISPRFTALVDAYPWESIPVAEADAGILAPAFLSGPVRIGLRLRDARTNSEAPCVPTRAWRDGDLRYRWAGETLGLKWDVILERSSEQELKILGGIESPDGTERPIEWTVFAQLPSPDQGLGVSADPSLLPFVAASLPGGAVVLLKDTLEPRESACYLDKAGTALKLTHQMMLTPRTLLFPNRGTISCSVRALAVSPDVPAFRAVIAALHERGELSKDTLPLESARSVSPKHIVFQPWSVDLPWPDAWPRTDASARAWLLLHAAVGDGLRIPDARSALLAGMRRADGGWDMELGDNFTPFGLRLPVSVNPALATTALAPWNPGRRAIQTLDGWMSSPSKGWMELEGECAIGAVDSNTAALAVARYPAVYRDPQGPPLVAAPHSSVELLRTIASRKPADRPVLAVRNGTLSGCSLSPWTDVFIECARNWMTFPAAERFARLIALRALAGSRPICFEEISHSEVSAADSAELLSLGIERISATDEADESDDTSRMAAQISKAGWQPWSAARSATPDVRIESFGAAGVPIRHTTVLSRASVAQMAEVDIPCSGSELAVVRPMTGEAEVLPATEGRVKVHVPLAAGEVSVLDWFDIAQADVERAFLATLKSDAARAAQGNLEQAIRARSAGWELDASMPVAALSGARNTVQIQVRNIGPVPGVVSRIRLQQGKAETDLSQDLRMLAGGEAVSVNGFVTDPAPIVVRADVQRESERLTLVRELRPAWLPMIEILPESNALVCAGASIPAVARVVNRSALPRRVTVELQGADAVAQTLDLGAGAEQTITIPVSGRENSVQTFTWRLTAEGGWTHEAPVRVEFLNMFQGALRDSRTHIAASSSETGCTPNATVDNRLETAWNSARGDASPWITFQPAGPVRASGIRVRWPYQGGVAQTPSKVALDVTDTDGKVRTMEANLDPAGISVIPFAPTPVCSVRMRLCPHSGPPSAPDRLWISEAELQ